MAYENLNNFEVNLMKLNSVYFILSLLPALNFFAQDGKDVALEESGYVTKAPASNVSRDSLRSRKNKVDRCTPEEEVIRSIPVITPSVAPHICEGTDTFITAEFIWWKTHLDAMEYAIGGFFDGYGVSSGNVSTGKAETPHFDFDPGVKLGLGWHADHDGWDLYADWTFLISKREKASLNNSLGSGHGMVSAQHANIAGNLEQVALSSATNLWKQHFNVIDIELGRDFFLSRYLTVRPQIGLKTGWVHEKTQTNLGIANIATVSSAEFKNTQNVWGVGVRSGLTSGWHLSKHWQIVGDFALSNFWGNFHRKFEQKNELLTGSVSKTQDTHQSKQSVIPVVETGIALGYVTWFSDNRYRFETRIGWDEQVWIGFNRSQDFVRQGNLSLHGLTFKTQLNF
jgi:hypothetical protein